VHLPSTASKAVTLAYPEEGGHVGFPNGAFPGRIDWLPGRILSFFDGAEDSAEDSSEAATRAPDARELCEADTHG
jgi:hypothetical protein